MTLSIDAVSHLLLKDVEVPAELSRGLRRADDYIRLAVSATFNVLKGLRGTEGFNLERCGLVLGSCFSTMKTNFEVLDDVVSGQQTSPTLFSHSVFNSAAGYIAATMGIMGAALAIVDFSFPFFKALQEGCLALSSGRLDHCVMLQVETYSDLLADGRTRLVADCQPWQPGAVCWLLGKDPTAGCGYLLDGIEIESRLSEPLDLLGRRETVKTAGEQQTVDGPLAAAAYLTGLIEGRKAFSELHEITSDCGRVELKLRHR